MEIKVTALLKVRDLALRSWAEELFSYLEKERDKNFILDFSGIDFISRTFANEYTIKKRTFDATIEEKNINADMKKMLNLAGRPQKTKTFL